MYLPGNNAAGGFDADAYEIAQVEALRPLLALLSPSDNVFNRVLITESPKALTLLFDLHGAAPYRKLMTHRTPSSASFGPAIKTANIDMLRVLYLNGFDMIAYGEKMIAHAVRQPTSDYLSFVRNEIGFQGSLLSCAHVPTLLADPKHYVVCELATELLEHFMAPDSDIKTELIRLFDRPFDAQTLRISAIALWGVKDLGSQIREYREPPRPSALQHLAAMTTTNHGQITLLGMEASLQDILSRPKTARFYGLTLQDLKKQSASSHV